MGGGTPEPGTAETTGCASWNWGREVRIPKTESGTAMSKGVILVFFIPTLTQTRENQTAEQLPECGYWERRALIKNQAHQNVSSWKAHVQKLPRNSDPRGDTEARWQEQVYRFKASTACSCI